MAPRHTDHGRDHGQRRDRKLLGDLPGLLLGAGALDAWITAVTGKKGRPAHVVTALCGGHAGPVQERLLAGARQPGRAAPGPSSARRCPVRRRGDRAGHRIRVKIGPHRAEREHDDVAAVALATGLPARAISRTGPPGGSPGKSFPVRSRGRWEPEPG